MEESNILRSYVDKLEPPFSWIFGWAYDASHPDSPLEVELLVDGAVKAVVRADFPRSDLISLGMPPCAFTFMDPALQPMTSVALRVTLADGTQSILGEYRCPLEPVRLVIWDLDETFWKGTVTEGGIEYLLENHDIVIELSRRGIINSICSKNDAAPILDILREKGIADYFVFPSISWEPKGARIAALIDAVQLRPTTVMFIDDNPNNRAEVAAMVPGIQVESETFLPALLDDARFAGKDDRDLTRLAQYKLLEKRKTDEAKASGNNEDFLRGCDIRVLIEYDVLPHLDRVIELINRTNQLNFTKQRLPEDKDEARRILTEKLGFFAFQAGLVKVVDKYGDYGFVGFFMSEALRSEHVPGAADRTLRHFCFSCRTLGMLVEQWLYQYLGRPQIRVVGEVLTDLFAPKHIDWIRLVRSIDDEPAAKETVAPEIRVYGGCEANAIGVYLTAYSPKVEVLGNFMAGGLFVRINSARQAVSMSKRKPEEFSAEAQALALPLDLCTRDYFATAAQGTVFIVSSGLDGEGRSRYRHRHFGWELVVEPMGGPDVDFTELTADELLEKLKPRYREEDAVYRDHVVSAAKHIRENYTTVPALSDEERICALRELIERIPTGSKLVFLLDHDAIRISESVLRQAGHVKHYNAIIQNVSKRYPFVGLVSFSDSIDSDSQIQIGGNHYDRMVYLRVAQRLLNVIRELPTKAAPVQRATSSPSLSF